MTDFKELTKAVTIRHNDKIKKACYTIFKELNLNNFWHYKISNKGEYYYLGSNAEISEFFAEMKYYIDYPYYRHPRFFRSGISYMNSVNYSPKIKNEIKIKSNCHHPILLIDQVHDGIEGFGFSSNSDNEHQLSLLINELPLLRLFCKYFRNENPALFALLEANKIDLLKLLGNVYSEEGPPVLPVTKYRNSLIHNPGLHNSKSLTNRESEVLKLYFIGNSPKQISSKLYRSKRTIEHHIERIKEKLDCPAKYDLMIKARELEKIGYFEI